MRLKNILERGLLWNRPRRARLIAALACAVGLLAFEATPLAAQNLVALEREGFPKAFQNGHRLVTVRHPPEKVLVFGLGPGELLIELGLTHLLVGRSTLDERLRPLPQYAEAWSSIPAFSHDDLAGEEAAAHGPDFAYGHFAPESPELGLEFLTVYASIASDKRGYYREVEELAAIFSVEDKAAAFLANLDLRLAGITQRVSAREPVRVMVIREIKNGSVVTAGGADFASEVLKLGGALNVFADLGRSPEPSSQEVANRRPDFIVVVNDGRSSPGD
ncbi:MAG: ABC transporter substrate-binding protein, partial [Deltaproteobacteria bacterium]|nr:ABC transporter substrate-binding protein [Deltaproteobacteria bacterium]